MNDIKIFYENTKDSLPHENIIKFLEIEKETGNAVDLGCGAGRDTIYLIKNGWYVVSVDREDNYELIRNRLNDEELNRFEFQRQNFEDLCLNKNNLLIANFSIPFCKKTHFNEFWNRITNSIERNRIFCWQFLWIK